MIYLLYSQNMNRTLLNQIDMVDNLDLQSSSLPTTINIAKSLFSTLQNSVNEGVFIASQEEKKAIDEIDKKIGEKLKKIEEYKKKADNQYNAAQTTYNNPSAPTNGNNNGIYTSYLQTIKQNFDESKKDFEAYTELEDKLTKQQEKYQKLKEAMKEFEFDNVWEYKVSNTLNNEVYDLWINLNFQLTAENGVSHLLCDEEWKPLENENNNYKIEVNGKKYTLEWINLQNLEKVSLNQVKISPKIEQYPFTLKLQIKIEKPVDTGFKVALTKPLTFEFLDKTANLIKKKSMKSAYDQIFSKEVMQKSLFHVRNNHIQAIKKNQIFALLKKMDSSFWESLQADNQDELYQKISPFIDIDKSPLQATDLEESFKNSITDENKIDKKFRTDEGAYKNFLVTNYSEAYQKVITDKMDEILDEESDIIRQILIKYKQSIDNTPVDFDGINTRFVDRNLSIPELSGNKNYTRFLVGKEWNDTWMLENENHESLSYNLTVSCIDKDMFVGKIKIDWKELELNASDPYHLAHTVLELSEVDGTPLNTKLRFRMALSILKATLRMVGNLLPLPLTNLDRNTGNTKTGHDLLLNRDGTLTLRRFMKNMKKAKRTNTMIFDENTFLKNWDEEKLWTAINLLSKNIHKSLNLLNVNFKKATDTVFRSSYSRKFKNIRGWYNPIRWFSKAENYPLNFETEVGNLKIKYVCGKFSFIDEEGNETIPDKNLGRMLAHKTFYGREFDVMRAINQAYIEKLIEYTKSQKKIFWISSEGISDTKRTYFLQNGKLSYVDKSTEELWFSWKQWTVLKLSRQSNSWTVTCKEEEAKIMFQDPKFASRLIEELRDAA